MRPEIHAMHDRGPEEIDKNDPRLDVPTITLYRKTSSGCLWLLASTLPCLAMIFAMLTDGDGVSVSQYALLLAIGLWIALWLADANNVKRLRQSGKPGSATVVDKFSYRIRDDRTYVVVYQFEHSQPDGQTHMVHVAEHSHSLHGFDVPLGHTMKFFSVPLTTSMKRNWPATWSLMSPNELQVLMFTSVARTAIIFPLLGVLALWARTAWRVADLHWPEMFSAIGGTAWWRAATSLDTVGSVWTTILQVPAVPVAGIIAPIIVLGLLLSRR